MNRSVSALNAIRGALVGDASAYGTHWIYDASALSSAISSNGGKAAFSEIVSTWHKAGSVKSGDITMYGEGALCLLDSLAESHGHFLPIDFRTKWAATFGPCGSFHGYCDKTTRITSLNILKANAEGEGAMYPLMGKIPGNIRGALFKSLSTTVALAKSEEEAGSALAAVATAAGADAAAAEAAADLAKLKYRTEAGPYGADDNQSNGMCRVLIASALFAGSSEFEAQVGATLLATQNNAEAVACGLAVGRMIEAAVLGTAKTAKEAILAGLPYFVGPAAGVLEVVEKAISMADAAAPTAGAPPSENVAANFDALKALNGNACEMKATIPGAIYAILRRGGGGDFGGVIEDVIAGGGETAARAAIAGGLLGALSPSGPPSEYSGRLSSSASGRIAARLEKLQHC